MSSTPVLYQSSTPEALSEDEWTALERTAKRLVRVSWIPAAYLPCPPQGNRPGKSIEQAENAQWSQARGESTILAVVVKGSQRVVTADGPLEKYGIKALAS